MAERETNIKQVSAHKAIVLQTIALIIVLLGLAVAAERRLTTIEVKATQETGAITKLQDAVMLLSNNQIRVVTLLDKIEQRHLLEDQRKAASAVPKNGK